MNMGKIRVGIIGLWNCASSLIQGISFYSKPDADSIGLIHEDIGGYKISDIEVVSAIDVNSEKIGKKIGEWIFSSPNCTRVFCPDVYIQEKTIAGPVLDGISERMAQNIPLHGLDMPIEKWKDVIVTEWRNKGVDIVISYLPVGSKLASIFYAECALEAKVAYANAIPEFICSDEAWSEKFRNAWIPCAWDDIKSQVGATIVHRCLVDLIHKRGQQIDGTYQLNIGWNTDFENMLDEERLASKRQSKTEAVTSLVREYDLQTRIGPSDHVPHLNDNKICYINIAGRQFGHVPFSLEVKLSVEDSPNSAGVIADVIRLLKIAKDRWLSGYQDFSSYYFKHPKERVSDEEARALVQEFLK